MRMSEGCYLEDIWGKELVIPAECGPFVQKELQKRHPMLEIEETTNSWSHWREVIYGLLQIEHDVLGKANFTMSCSICNNKANAV